MAVRAVDHPEQLTQFALIQLMNDALPEAEGYRACDILWRKAQ